MLDFGPFLRRTIRGGFLWESRTVFLLVFLVMISQGHQMKILTATRRVRPPGTWRSRLSCHCAFPDARHRGHSGDGVWHNAILSPCMERSVSLLTPRFV